MAAPTRFPLPRDHARKATSAPGSEAAASAGHGMAGHWVEIAQPEQGMYQAAVAYVNFRRPDEAFAGILGPRLQAAHQEQIDHEVEITPHGLAAGANRSG